jgi:hypothetical protein
MSSVLRRTIPAAILAVVGILMFIEFFFVTPPAYIEAMKDLQNATVIIAAFAMGIGAVNLLLTHSSFIMKREPDQWYYSLWLLIVMAIFVVLGIATGTDSDTYQFFFQNFFMPVDMTLYSLIGWLIVYAIYLTFRARNAETTLLLLVAFFALLGNAPISGAVLPALTDIKSWLAAVPNTGAVRGFNIAMALGSIVVGIRTLAGRERAALGG